MTKILMVLTSHDQLGDTGKKTGFWLEEFAAPYYVFKDAGAEITLASPAGGQPPLDPKSDEPDAQTDATRRFRADQARTQALAATRKLAAVKAADFDAVFYPGGHGPLWDLAERPGLDRADRSRRWPPASRSPPSATRRACCATSRRPTARRWSRASA